jgi:hypothetical protein
LAESLLEARYPERYGLLGGAVWGGRVYEGPQPAPPLLALFGRERVYHGPWASGLFQSVYTPDAPWWLSFTATPEMYGVNAALAASAGWLQLSGGDHWAVPAGLALLGLGAGVACCLDSARRMCARDELSGWARWRRLLGVTALHLLQPWARWRGRLHGMWRDHAPQRWPQRAEGRIWSGWDRREEWLRVLTASLSQQGLKVRDGGAWDRHDLLVEAFPGYTATLESVVEYESQIRFRGVVRTSPPLLVGQGILLALIAATAATPLMPLAFPLAAFLAALRREKARLAATLTVVGLKTGVALRMVPLAKQPGRAEAEAERLPVVMRPPAAWGVRTRAASGEGSE